MNCEVLNKLDELEKIEIIRLSERVEALNELKTAEVRVYLSDAEFEIIMQQIKKREDEANLLIKQWWKQKYEKYMDNEADERNLSSCCDKCYSKLSVK